MQPQKFSLKKRWESLKHALNGIKILIREEHNARLHLLITIAVVFMGYVLNVSAEEWIALTFAIGFVIVVEIVNSSIEKLCDLITTETSSLIKKIKDLAAAAVLLSAITASVIGLLVFGPKILT